MLTRLLAGSLLAAATLAAQVDFARDIEPIFHQHCYACHGASQQMSGLRLDQRAAAFKGGYSGPVVARGNSGASKLIERVSSDKEGFRMPPAGAALSQAQVAALAAWIDAGAEWPERAAAEPLSSERKAGHWSFQPIRAADVPAREAIDRFVRSKLAAEGFEPAPEADKITLVRRLYFDLIGLPPTPEEIDAFVADRSPDAYERLVDELLRSPHFGEKWAIGWLDAARYADSDGYERDPLRPYAWRWRQWVIESLNRDQPFDEFTIEQIAGDLLPAATVEQQVATGFLRNGIKNREAGVKAEEKRFEEIIDRVSTIGTVWLGLTLGCAQCHDHKYDPISQQELYQLYAFFENAVELDIDAPEPGEAGVFMRAYPHYRAARDKILSDAAVEPLYDRWRAEMVEALDAPGVRTDWDHSLTEWRAAKNRADWFLRADESELTQIERDERMDWFLSRVGPDFSKDEELANKLESVAKQLQNLRNEAMPQRTLAYAITERRQPRPTHIALRGDWRAPGVEVEPLTPAVLPALPDGEAPPRLRLARWLVAEDNPLTARVFANRVWQELFGRGLVRTLDDFGLQGDEPSHPELLDWLAADFSRNGWSRKRLIRRIVNSATYRQSSDARPELAERDPANQWLARQTRLRLPAELLRDNALAVSGLLNPRIGGESIHPPQPAGISELSYSKKDWPEDQGPERYRRGLYIFLRRTSPYPMLTNFDAPTTLVASVERTRSNTALQALNLLNDPVFVEAAQGLALRAVSERSAFAERLERMFRLALGRPPAPPEQDRLATYFEREKQTASSENGADLVIYVPAGVDRADLAAWTAVARGLLNLDEFMTRE